MAKRFRNCVGPQVRKLRMAKKWSQDQLAAKLAMAGLDNFDRVTVAKIESQIRSVFDFELQVIARILGVAVGELLPSTGGLKKDLSDLLAGERKGGSQLIIVFPSQANKSFSSPPPRAPPPDFRATLESQ